jgi:hypothetical protein
VTFIAELALALFYSRLASKICVGYCKMAFRSFFHGVDKSIPLSVVLGLLSFVSCSPVALATSLTTGLAAYWSFDEASGDAASSVNDNLLINHNVTGYSAGRIGNAAHFVPTQSNYFKIADDDQTGLDMTGGISLSFWVKLASQPTGAYPYYHIINKWNEADQRSFSLTYTTSDDTPRLYLAVSQEGCDDSPTDAFFLNASLSDSVWHHVVVAWNASLATTDFYINGSHASTAMGLYHYTSMFDSTADFLIGTHIDEENSAHGYLDGMMDEVGIWSRVLDANEASTLYHSGAGLAYPFITASEPSTFALAAVGAIVAVAYIAGRKRISKSSDVSDAK